MTLTLEQVEHIANLARLNLTEEEKARFQQQLSAILDHFEQLQAADTSQLPADFVPESLQSRLRRDDILPNLNLEKLLHNAPDTKKKQFKIPPVFE